MKRLASLLLVVLLVGCGAARGYDPKPGKVSPAPTHEMNAQTVTEPLASPEAFLKHHGLDVKGAPEKFRVDVPASWEVPLGAYPVGLYWGLANEFSRDVGLDLKRLQGKTVDVWRYSLAGGLPGEGEQRRFQYPSDVILLVQDQAVVGAWLSFNKRSIGPSMRKRTLKEITGLTLEQWLDREGYFADSGPNGDLSNLGPVEVLGVFVEAINQGDKTRAAACLTPRMLLDSLTTNLLPSRLYNPGFGRNNAMTENIVKGKVISAKLYDPDGISQEVKEIGDRTRVGIAAEMELTWRDAAFNTTTGRTTRFAIMEKGANGWKLSGLGTGP